MKNCVIINSIAAQGSIVFERLIGEYVLYFEFVFLHLKPCPYIQH